MAFEHKEGWGSLTKNEQHEVGDNRPMMKGDGMYNGEIVDVAIWPGKPDKNGTLRYSVKIAAKEQQARVPGSAKTPVNIDDEIPF